MRTMSHNALEKEVRTSVTDISKIVYLLLWQKQGSGDRMHWRVSLGNSSASHRRKRVLYSPIARS